MIRLAKSGLLRAAKPASLARRPVKEILQQPQSGRAALFRVELGGHDVALLHGADKPLAVIGRGQAHRFVLGNHMIGMDEIKFFIPPESLEKADGWRTCTPFQPIWGTARSVVKRRTAPEDPQAGNAGGLLAAFKQGLEPQADAQKRPARGQIGPQGIQQLFFPQDPHHVPEMAHSRENQLFGPPEVFRAFHQPDLFSQAFDGVDYAAHVSRAVIQKGNHYSLILLYT